MADASTCPRPTLDRSIHHMDNRPFTRELSLYNGVSNRSRGWKTKKSDKSVEMRPSRRSSVVRYDGASMSSNVWDNLKRDPELWYRDGNCYIHLYGQGQSRRGPAFKVPFSGLLEGNCYPFIDRFMGRNIRTPTGHVRHDNSDPARRSRIELFIPAPSRSDKQQSYKYHLATRNFIAYVFRRSMVGENLGTALIGLVHSMYEFRTADVDNVQDLTSYLDEEGYLNFKNNPTHAIAILRLAEVFQLKDLYINAFAHCCGMSDQLLIAPEYQLVSPASRKLIRCARVELNLRLGQSATMVENFLRCELSEANFGLYAGARAHLERFRNLLVDFYTAKFGSYPPPSTDSRATIFEVDIFRTMRADFEALFHYLVDETFDTTQNSPFLAQGGICTLQCIQSFDAKHEFKPLFHPLPLLPKVFQESNTKLAWLGKQIKSDRKRREMMNAAMLSATNPRVDLMKNGLVRVYRGFEQDLAYLPTKADKLENLGPIDGRKVRWILIYVTYQALRQATEVPPEVDDADGAPYHLCISTADLPPWDEERPVHSLVRRQTDHIIRSVSTSAMRQDSTRASSPSHQHSFEIKPDIDYFAITHRDDNSNEVKDGGSSRLRRAASWKGSLTRSLSRSLTTRRPSATRLTKPQPDKTVQSVHHNQGQYHEIVVRGYGNGINNINTEFEDIRPPGIRASIIAEEGTISASPSRYSSNSDLRRSDQEDGDEDEESATKTTDTSVCESPTETAACLPNNQHKTAPARYRTGSASTGTHRKLLREEAVSCGLIRRRSRSVDGGSNPRNRRRFFTEPWPLHIRKVHSAAPQIEMPMPKAPTAWEYVKAVMEVKASSWSPANDVQPEWEQYNDLGGLTEFSTEVQMPTQAHGVRKVRSSLAMHG
ncbi:uncharacterized protein F4822DRAFT_26379 [Hypoxylon trugodes]|uniref:uncharacterized protein n=1 Tax=Hypoxylon trugodes TaxID=326681 RepID=UPI00219E2EE5|nr:uncharacterized protein F4822DRAFT_26379 [Hypoxylon trugodes]KAI1393809.1 hypothetical protein F4822DRAFT_26379 [Hypoxylon trugodes]